MSHLENEHLVIYQNQNVYMIFIDNMSSKYDKEIYGTLLLTEKRVQNNSNYTSEKYIIWKPRGDDIPKGVRLIRIEVSNLKSIKRAKMTMGNGSSYMIFYEKEGNHNPMLIFPDGGTKNLIEKLENFVSVTRSPSDKNLYLIYNKKDFFDTYDNLSSLASFLHDAPSQVPRSKNAVWSGLINIGANLTNHFPKYVLDDNNKIRNMLKEDALGVDINELKQNQDMDNDFLVVSKPIRINLPPASPILRREPLTEHEWNKYLTNDGSVTCVNNVLERIFKGGIEENLRKTVWKYLLGYYDWNKSIEDNEKSANERKVLLEKLQQQWQTIFPEQEEKFSIFQDRKSIIDRDVHRTDRMLEFYSSDAAESNLSIIRNCLMSYSMYNFNLGYVQGMNDLLAPILYVMNDENDAFWCFVKLMDRMENNFNFEQNGIKRQFLQLYTLLQIFDPELAVYLENKGCHDMLFCFRFLLVNFKRELSYENTMLLWEVLWTDFRCKNFHLLFTLAVLLSQRSQIIENRYGLNEILKHMNDIVLNHELNNLLCRAESLYFQLQQIWTQIPSESRVLLDFSIISTRSFSVSSITSPTGASTQNSRMPHDVSSSSTNPRQPIKHHITQSNSSSSFSSTSNDNPKTNVKYPETFMQSNFIDSL